MEEAFDAASFVLRSRNRLAILTAVAAHSRTRADLVSTTGSSRETVGRILRQFEKRGWVEHDGGTYAATARGRAIATTIDGMLERLEALAALDPVLPWFPVDDLDLPAGALADAAVTVPDVTQPVRPTNRLTELGSAAGVVRLYAVGVTPDATALHRDRVRDAGQSLELATTPDGVDAARGTPPVREPLADLLETDAVVAVTDPDPLLPFFGRFDGTSVIGVTNDAGSIAGVVEWTDDRIVDWVDDRFDEMLASADELTREDLEP